MLSVKNLSVKVEDKVVLRDMNLEIGEGEIHALMGPNGSGKSSLANVLMGNSNYVIESGKIFFESKNLLTMNSDERARKGLFIAWQNPVMIPGVSVFSLCKASYEAQGKTIEKLTEFKQKLEALAQRVGMNKDYVGRNVNEGFSGGERKRLELLQLLLLEPKLAVFDEIDSGLDSAGVKILIKIMQDRHKAGTGFLLITHNKKILDELDVEKAWMITN